MSDDQAVERRPTGPASTQGGYDEDGQAWGSQLVADAADDELQPGGRLWRLIHGGD